MPWETKFNIDEAIDQATEVFWAKGYQSTSLTDLLSAMNIKKGSFYNTFGSKKALFRKALNKYDDKHRRTMVRGLEKISDPILSLESFFDVIIEQALADPDKKGCMIINTAINLPNYDTETAETIKNGLTEVENYIAKQISNGISMGSIKQDIEVERVAKTILALAVSLRVLSRGVFNQDDLFAIKSQAMNLLS